MEQHIVGAAAPASSTETAMDRTRALFERPPVSVNDETTFREVKAAVDTQFAEGSIEGFLRSLGRASLRVRDFEAVLSAGKLGSSTAAQYGKLSPGDRGQIRELYLASLEQVASPLRDRFFKLYAYY